MNLCRTPPPVIKICEWGPWASDWDLLSGTYSLFWNWLFGKILWRDHAKPLCKGKGNCKASVSQFWLTLNAYLNWFKSVKRSNNAPGTFRQSFRRHCSQSCAYSDETTWHPRWWRIPLLLKTPENAIFETLNFKMSLDATALKNLCLGASSKGAYHS